MVFIVVVISLLHHIVSGLLFSSLENTCTFIRLLIYIIPYSTFKIYALRALYELISECIIIMKKKKKMMMGMFCITGIVCVCVCVYRRKIQSAMEFKSLLYLLHLLYYYVTEMACINVRCSML